MAAKLRSNQIFAVNSLQHTNIQTTQVYGTFVDKQVAHTLCNFHVVKIPVDSHSAAFKGIPPNSCHIRDLAHTLSCAFAQNNIDTAVLQFTPAMPTRTEPHGPKKDLRIEHPLQGKFAHTAYHVRSWPLSSAMSLLSTKLTHTPHRLRTIRLARSYAYIIIGHR